MLKNNLYLQNHCNSLILFTSESCNLSCSYCEMANHINKQAHCGESKKVKDSLINGQYLQTIKNAVKRLELSPLQFEHLELWGQEPTLTLKEFNVFFPEFYNYFIGLKHMLFSTNGVSNIDEILNFINVLKTTLQQRFVFTLQFSYDGKYQTQKNRGVNPSIILDNIEYFIKQLNNINLGNYLNIEIIFHNVVDNNTISYFSNPDNNKELLSYLEEFSSLSEYYINLNNNSKVIIKPFSPGLINPFNATKKNGQELYNFYKNCEQIGSNLIYKNCWEGLPRQIAVRTKDINYDNIMFNFLQNLNFYKKYDKQLLYKLSNKLNCNFNYNTLKIRYDGTMIHCQNALMGVQANEIIHRTENDYIIQKRLISKHFYPNILTDSDEIIDQYLYLCELYSRETFPMVFSQVCNLLSILLHSHQIDEKYKDPHEFLKCAYYLTFSNSCPHTALMYSGNIVGTYVGWIRFLCNGFMDIVENEIKENKNANCARRS